MTREEIFDLIRDVRDPEHEEATLEELRVARIEDVHVGGITTVRRASSSRRRSRTAPWPP